MDEVNNLFEEDEYGKADQSAPPPRKGKKSQT